MVGQALGITKRGNKYLRTFPDPVRGRRCPRSPQPRPARKLRGLSARAHRNTVIVALASKLVAWAVLRLATT